MENNKIEIIYDINGKIICKVDEFDIDEIIEDFENGHMSKITVYKAYTNRKIIFKIYPNGHTVQYFKKN